MSPRLSVSPSLYLSLFLLLIASALTGCCPTKQYYTGPTDSMAKVVADINANNSKVPTLWSNHNYSAYVVDDKQHSHQVGGDGVLLYTAPNSMRLKANAAVVGTVFEIGSNPKSFWLKLAPNTGDTLWWGNYADLNPSNIDKLGIPIRPDMVLDVLGIATINTNFNEPPVPTMRFDSEIVSVNNLKNAPEEVNQGSYVFIWNGKLPDRWYAQREVWYDRATKRPKLMLIYDTNGRVVLRAELSDFRQITVNGVPSGQWPWIPGHYVLTFPDNGSRLSFTLADPELQHTDSETGRTIPNPNSFRMPNPESVDVNHVIQIGQPSAQ